MEKILNKLRQCINYKFDEAIDLIDKERINVRKTINYIAKLMALTDLFDNSIKEDNNEVVDGFDVILNFMDLNNFSIREKFMTVMYFIEKNISRGFIDRQSLMICLDKIYDVGISSSDIEKIEQTIENGRMVSILEKIQFSLNNVDNNDDPYMLSDDEKRVELVICSYLMELVVESGALRRYHLIINEHYLEKKESYTHEDIVIVIDALSKLKVSASDCTAMKYIMEKDLEKRKNKSKKVAVVQHKIANNESKNTISNKEYKTLLQQLKCYFDIESKTVTHLLSMDEIIRCTEIMIKLGFSVDEIKGYLKIMDKNQETNPITWYLNNYEKLSYYSDKQCIKNIDSYFKEIFICSEEDYILWKSSIAEELEELKVVIPKTYKYELEMATRRTK